MDCLGRAGAYGGCGVSAGSSSRESKALQVKLTIKVAQVVSQGYMIMQLHLSSDAHAQVTVILGILKIGFSSSCSIIC